MRWAIRASVGLCFLLGTTSILLGAQKGQGGGIIFTVSFEEKLDENGDPVDNSLPPPIDQSGADAFYCGAIQAFSADLYRTTEGAHWIRRVRFFRDLSSADVLWRTFQKPSGGGNFNRGLAGFKNHIEIDTSFTPADDPGSFAGLLNHEFGHFFYDLPDEYIDLRGSQGGRTGICRSTYTVDANGNVSGTVCDEDSINTCGIGDFCIFKGQCIQGFLFSPCVSDLHCGILPVGRCLGKNEDRNDAVSGQKQRICLNDPAVSDTCLMAGGGKRHLWCDGGKSNGGQISGASHRFQLVDSGDVLFDLGNAVGEPDGSNGRDYVGHSCWALAAETHDDLEGVHELGEYKTLSVVEAENGPVPPVECQWLVDPPAVGGHPLLLVDMSGSMVSDDVSDPPVPAVNLALDGALYFYNQVPFGNWVGVSLFNTTTREARGSVNFLNTSFILTFRPKLFNVSTIVPVSAQGGTDIAQAIDVATAQFTGDSQPPIANRSIVLFSDGLNNVGNSPLAAARRACDLGIAVHTIAYGDADSDALRQLSACGGISQVASGLAQVDPLTGSPRIDALEIKTALARMSQRLADRAEVLEVRSRLPRPSEQNVETQVFEVAAGTRSFRFGWLGDHTCAEPAPIGLAPLGTESSSTANCIPILSLLQADLVAPGGQVFPASPDSGAEDGVYLNLKIDAPPSGIWQARLHLDRPNGFTVDEWERKVPAARVGWIAHLDHPALEGRAWMAEYQAPPGGPVTILAQMTYGEIVTGIEATAEVQRGGRSWSVQLFDDGLHRDGGAEDGVYGGSFASEEAVTGAYRVAVRLRSLEEISTTVPATDQDEEPELPTEPPTRPGPAVVLAETRFVLSERYRTPADEATPGAITFQCPELRTGRVVRGLSARVVGLDLDPETTVVSLGGRGVSLENVAFQRIDTGNLASGPQGIISFDVSVEPNAQPGPRALSVQRGFDAIRKEGACEVILAQDCNENGIPDSTDISGGASQDINGNEVPDECEIVVIPCTFFGTAEGGQVSVTLTGFTATCTVVIVTTPGQSSETVAMELAAAINSDACMNGQGFTASASGSSLQMGGFLLRFDGSTVADPGLSHEIPIIAVPTLSPLGLAALTLLVLLAGIALRLRRRNPTLY